MFNDYDELRSLLETADTLAYADDWPELYDEAQLAKNDVPVYSATYIEDMYVHFDFAKDTASKIKNCKNFITNVLYHDALVHKTDELSEYFLHCVLSSFIQPFESHGRHWENSTIKFFL